MAKRKKQLDSEWYEITETGDFGAVRTKTRFMEKAFYEKPVTDTRIQRFSSDADILIEIGMITCLDKTSERFNLELFIKTDANKKWLVRLDFDNNCGNYGFSGNLGMYSIWRIPIPDFVYAIVRNKVIQMCNPSFDYGSISHSSEIDSIIDLLRECKDEDLNKYLIDFWDSIIVRRERPSLGTKQ